MDLTQGKPMCWEITGCGRQNDCKVLQLAKSIGRPCWEVVGNFDDYRTTMNVCGDCIVSVLNNGQRPLGGDAVDDFIRNKGEDASHYSCPGLSSS
ncbi:MAG: hypothetical protein RQ753_09790 [Desulfurivibrionaceae bacterium]|nr:hypothetical protein [Desulfobulbales bacterium]MDT8335979.1 hypothetical protein [Desulfurivibrionaceae bacterium]